MYYLFSSDFNCVKFHTKDGWMLIVFLLETHYKCTQKNNSSNFDLDLIFAKFQKYFSHLMLNPSWVSHN
jgi:hypothetical protein